jgi:hypothetical protein
LARPLHLCIATIFHRGVQQMPDESNFKMEFIPDYGLDEFDQLFTVLEQIDAVIRGEIGDLVFERELDPKEGVTKYNLSLEVAEGLDQLQGFGDTGDLQPFGTVEIATVSGASYFGGGYNAAIYARRNWATYDACIGKFLETKSEFGVTILDPFGSGEIIYEFTDDSDGAGELAISAEPLTMQEMIKLVDAFLFENAPGTPTRNDWRPGYLRQEPDFDLTVRSDFYPELKRWYLESVAEWYRENPQS